MSQEQRRPTTVYLMRHGQTEHNASGRLMGHRDVSLDETGLVQARTAASLLASRPLRAIYTSDLQRARGTAEAVAGRLGLEPVPCPSLREVDVGEWEGLTRAEIERDYPEVIAALEKEPVRTKRPGGESFGQMESRVWKTLEEIAAAHPGEEVLVVSHGGPMRAVICRVLGLAWARRGRVAFQNCGILALIYDGAGGLRLEVPGWAVPHP